MYEAIIDDERRQKIDAIKLDNPHRVLCATDCLSEGVNLQEKFNAVIHYDLPWNPNRLEQREGRVDRFGQREHLKGIAVYNANGAVLALTPGLPTLFQTRPATATRAALRIGCR